jgi:flagellar assembly protein FliH
MSSSPSRSPVPGVVNSSPVAGAPEASPFPYSEIRGPAFAPHPAGLSLAESGLCASGADASFNDAAARETRAREQGREEGRADGRKDFEEQLARERAAVVAALEQFTRDRAAYYQSVEAEVVQLALSIARKILHREAQVDPLLLAGVVRVALDKIEGATGVVLLVHPQHAADWSRYLAAHMDPEDLPEIVEDPALPLDQCRLRTSMGTAELGLEVQLKEIEHGLMDLMAARPETAS